MTRARHFIFIIRYPPFWVFLPFDIVVRESLCSGSRFVELESRLVCKKGFQKISAAHCSDVVL
jgi:hypothetical protein